MTSKTLFAVLALAAFVASPALAKKPVHHRISAGPYAAAVAGPMHSSVGTYLGTDPDPRIRFELQRDSDTAEGANP